MFKTIKLIIVFLILSCALFGQHEIILETDFDGNVVMGSKDALIKEIRKGRSVRVGYQLDFDKDKVSDFDHWTDAEFITILDGEVFTQIKNINMQVPDLKIPQVDIMPVNTMWTAILGTNSLLKNRYVYGELKFETDNEGKPIVTPQVEKELKKREVRTWKVATFWAVEGYHKE